MFTRSPLAAHGEMKKIDENSIRTAARPEWAPLEASFSARSALLEAPPAEHFQCGQRPLFSQNYLFQGTFEARKARPSREQPALISVLRLYRENTRNIFRLNGHSMYHTRIAASNLQYGPVYHFTIGIICLHNPTQVMTHF